MRILANLDLAKNELQNARIQNLAAVPANPVTGQIYYNTTDKTVYVWTGGIWLDMGVVFANKSILDAITAAFTTALKTKLDGIEAGANKYIHPSTHPASMITESDTKRFVTDTEKTSWNAVTNKADKTYVDTELGKKSDMTHNHTLTGLSEKNYSSLTGRPALGTAASKNVGTSAGQIPVLDTNGKLEISTVPAIAITDTFVVSTEAAMLALDVQVGDVCVRTDLAKSFILKTEPASTLANWQELLNPESPVQSVNGKVGAVTITKSDVSLGSVANYGIATQAEAEAGASDAKYMTPLKAKQAIAALQAVKSVAGKTGTVSLVKGDVGLGNVENKSSATIRGEITKTNVVSGLGYTPVKDGGSTPEFISGTEANRPTATDSGRVYFATDTQRIWKDTGNWTQMGGQEIPIASQDVLGLIKVGANLSISADGTLSAYDDPVYFVFRQESFTAAAGQTTFNLTKGTYKPNTNSITWYMYGQKQPNDALIEASSTSFKIAGGVPEGTDIIVEYIEIIRDVEPFPYHANEHLTGGADAIPTATETADGLIAKEDIAKLNGIEDGANKYTHPSTHPASMITESTSRRFVTDAEKSTWNARTRKYTISIGNGSATEFSVTHGLGTLDVTASLREPSTGDWVITDIKTVDSNNIKLLFAQPPAANQYRLTVVG